MTSTITHEEAVDAAAVRLSRIFTLGLAELVEHISGNDLPFPDDIYPVVADERPARLAVRVYGKDHQAWLDTVHVDLEENRDATDRAGVTRFASRWQVRLPAGTRLELHTLRDAPLGTLSVVKSGASS